jgi:hypothetical protein
MKKVILPLVLVLIIVSQAFSQQGYDQAKEKYLQKKEGFAYPNVIKINTLALPLNNISVSYERAISPRFSFSIGAGYKYSGSEPGIINVDSDKIDVSVGSITGYSITPEIRWYLKKCENRFLEGFYASLYLRYTKYGTTGNFTHFPDEYAPQQFTADVDLTEYGAGIQLGYQLVLWKRLNIDFLFFGPRYSNYRLGYEFNQQVSEEFLTDLSDYLNDVLDRFGVDYEVELKQSGETKASHSFTFANMRFGIAFGFAF